MSASAPTLRVERGLERGEIRRQRVCPRFQLASVHAGIFALVRQSGFNLVFRDDDVLARQRARAIDERSQRRRERLEGSEAERLGGRGVLHDLKTGYAVVIGKLRDERRDEPCPEAGLRVAEITLCGDARRKRTADKADTPSSSRPTVRSFASNTA